MALKFGLLGLLNYQPMTGYDLSKEFESSLNYFWSAKTSQIYRELDAMEKGGWLTSERIVQEDKPNKRVYSITPEGKKEFINWLESYEQPTGGFKMRNPFLMRIFFGAELEKEKTIELLRNLRNTITAHSASLGGIMDEIDAEQTEQNKHIFKYYKLTVLAGEMNSKFNIEWIDKCIEILNEED